MEIKLQQFIEDSKPSAPAGVYVVRWAHEVKHDGIVYTPYDGITFRTELAKFVPFPEGERVVSDMPIPVWAEAFADMFGDAWVSSVPMFASEAKAAGEAYMKMLNEFLAQLS